MFSRLKSIHTLVLMACLVLAGCRGKTLPPKGELMLAISTDLQVPKDFDSIRVTVSSFGTVRFNQDFQVGKGHVTLPATLGIVVGNDPSQPVTIRVTSSKNGKVRTLREIVTTVPVDHIATLYVSIEWLCLDQVTINSTGDVSSSCDTGATCVAGSCVTTQVDSSTLTNYQPSGVFGGGDGTGTGSCFDTLQCFAGGQDVPVDTSNCTIAKVEATQVGTGVSVAMVLDPNTEGICGPEACLVPIDADATSGWTSDGNKIQLPKPVCQRLTSGDAKAVAVTTVCAAKTSSLPTCGDWSSVSTMTATIDAGAPLNFGVGGTTGTTGGANPVGGTSAIAGAGGTSSSAGTKSGGGSTATGGTTSTGGTTNATTTGGTVSTGGAAAGGAATGGAVSTGGAATGGYSATAGCPGTGGPSMVKLPQGYCIDSTEVTRDQYAAWLATTPTLPASSDANCGWKSTGSYAADATCMASSAVCQGTACGNHPQVCMDWCDAYAYCAGVGKRLCGKIGGGTNLYADYANVSLSQWYNACTSAGANPNYPYVGAYQPTACNGPDLGKSTTVAAGSLPGCQAPAPYNGVYDFSGNVWEWEDSCSGTGQGATCHMRGGSFQDASSTVTCGYNGGYTRNYVVGLGTVGFRCCSP